MRKVLTLACVAVLLAASVARAADFDGSKPLICAAQETRDCISGEHCLDALPADVGLPTFMHIDFAARTIRGTDRTTRMQGLETSPQQVLMQGVEMGYAWNIALDAQTGDFAGAVTNREGVFAIFGVCTPQ